MYWMLRRGAAGALSKSIVHNTENKSTIKNTNKNWYTLIVIGMRGKSEGFQVHMMHNSQKYRYHCKICIAFLKISGKSCGKTEGPPVSFRSAGRRGSGIRKYRRWRFLILRQGRRIGPEEAVSGRRRGRNRSGQSKSAAGELLHLTEEAERPVHREMGDAGISGSFLYFSNSFFHT